MAWVILALRRLRDDLAPTLGLAVLVLVTAALATTAPRVLADLADGAVRAEIDAAPAAARNIALSQHRLILPGPADDILGPVHDAGLDHEATYPPAIRDLITERGAVIESGRFRLTKPTTDPAFVRLRIQDGIEDHIRYVDGVPPTGTTSTRDDVGPEKIDGVPVYEAAVSRATAERFGLSLGEVVELLGDPGDTLIGRQARDVYAYAKLTGIYEVDDPAADYWLDDPQLIHPVIRALSSEVQLLDAALLLDPAAYDPLVRNTQPATHVLGYTWRSFLDASKLTDRNLDRLILAFRRLQVMYPSANVTPTVDTGLRTGMLPLLEDHRARWTAAASTIAVMALGPALVAVGTLALIAILASRRRRSTMALARSRGATGLQVVVPVLAEGLLISVPAAVLAFTAAVALIPAGRLSITLAAAVAVVAVTVAVVIASVAAVARSQGPDRRPDTRIIAGVGNRRLVFEGLLVALAIGGAYLLRERGVAAIAGASTTAGFDPLIAAVPALVGIAAGIVVARLYPIPLAGVAWVAARGRGLVAMLAARRAREGGAGAAVLLVLLATATVGTFAAASLDNLNRGADLAAWQDVGGWYRLQQPNGPLPRTLDPSGLPGVDAASGVFEASLPLDLTGPQSLVEMPDAAALEGVLAGTPVEPSFPAGFTTPAPGPIPAIVSQSIVDSPRGVKAGETFRLSIEGYTLTYVAAEVRDSFPGVPIGRHFVIVAREAFLAQAPPARVAPVWAVVRAPDDAAAAIRSTIAESTPSVEVASQAEQAAALRGAPVTNAVRALILAAALVTVGYAALGVAAALALAGLARTQETAHLRTLGLTGRQALQLVVAEHGPATLAAFVLGGLLGVLLFVLLRPALGLASLVGSPVDVPVVIEGLPLVLILLVMTAVVGAGLMLGAVLQRRVAPTAALRGRFE